MKSNIMEKMYLCRVAAKRQKYYGLVDWISRESITFGIYTRLKNDGYVSFVGEHNITIQVLLTKKGEEFVINYKSLEEL